MGPVMFLLSHGISRVTCNNVAIITIGSGNEAHATLDVYISLPRECCQVDEEYWLGVSLACV